MSKFIHSLKKLNCLSLVFIPLLTACGSGDSGSDNNTSADQPPQVINPDTPTEGEENSRLVAGLEPSNLQMPVRFIGGQVNNLSQYRYSEAEVQAANAGDVYIAEQSNVEAQITGYDTGTLTGKLRFSFDIQDPEGLHRAFISFSGSSQTLELCNDSGAEPCADVDFNQVVLGLEPSFFGLSSGQLILELWTQDSLEGLSRDKPVVEFAGQLAFNWQTESISGVVLSRDGTDLNISWQGLSSAQRYNVYFAAERQLNQNNATQLALGQQFLALDTTSFTLNNVEPTQDYYVLVTGVSDVGESAFSNIFYIEPGEETAEPVNTAPQSSSLSFTTNEDVNLQGNLLAQATDAENDTLTVVELSTAPSLGNISFDNTGNFTYQPNENVFGQDQFSFVITDGQNNNTTVSASINVEAVNDAPIVLAESYSLAEQLSLTVAAPGLLGNDSDIETQALTLDTSVISNPEFGSVSLNSDGSFSFTIDAQPLEETSVSFDYRVFDSQGASSNATATINIAGQDISFSLIADSYQVDEDNDLVVNLVQGVLANDDVAKLTAPEASVTTQPVNGSLFFNADGSFTYTPKPDFFGNDTFTYQVTNELQASQQAVVTISVTGINDAPAVQDDSYSTTQGQNLIIAAPGVLANDSDLDQDNLIVSLVSDTTQGNLSLSADGSFSYQANNSFVGTDSFSYSISDGTLSAQGSVAITIAEESATVANNDTASLNEGGTVVISPLDNDVSASTLTIVAASTSNGQLSFTDSSITYDPSIDFNGITSINYTIEDSLGRQSSAVIQVTVNPVNDAPTISGTPTTQIDEREFYTFTPTVQDIDNDTLTLSITNLPSWASFDTATGTLSGQAVEGDYQGIVITVTDSAQAQASLSAFDISVVNTNTAPVITDATVNLTQSDAAPGFVVTTVSVTDPDSNDTQTFSIESGNAGGIFLIDNQGQLVLNDPNLIDFTQSLPITVTVKVSDSQSESDTAVITVNLVLTNNRPVLTVNNATLAENAVLGSTVTTATVTDADQADTHTFTITAGDDNNVFSIDAAGVISIQDTNQIDFSTEASRELTITVTDSGSPNLSTSEVVTISLQNINDAPSLTGSNASIAENAANGDFVTTLTVTDPDSSDSHTFSITSGNDTNIFAINSNGVLSVNDASQLDFETTTSYSLTLQVADSATPALTDSLSLTITITDANDAPELTASNTSIAESAQVADLVTQVTFTDQDPGQIVTWELLSGNDDGIFAIDTNGQITVADTTNLDFETTNSYGLTVKATDSGTPNMHGTVFLRVDITDVNEAPIWTGASSSIAENSANGTIVGTVPAVDPEGGEVFYDIVASTVNGAFTINVTTGEISVVDSSLLDYETSPTIDLTVEVSDINERAGDAIYQVQLTDVYEPVGLLPATFEIYELQSVNTVVGSLVVDNFNQATNYIWEITSGNTDNTFFIDVNGDVKVANNIKLTVADNPSFTLNIKVSDGVNSATAVMTINLLSATQVQALTLDTSYGLSGRALGETYIADLANRNAAFQRKQIAIQDDNKPLVISSHPNGTKAIANLVRYNQDGSVDTSFANKGIFSSDFSKADGAQFQAIAVNSTHAFAVGYTYDADNIYNFLITKIDLVTGQLDTSFDNDGYKEFQFNTNNSNILHSVYLENDLIYVSGQSRDASLNKNYYVGAFYQANGTEVFSREINALSESNENAVDILAYPNDHINASLRGKVVIAGKGGSSRYLFRLTSAGVLDSEWNDPLSDGSGDGIIQLGTLSNPSIAIQSDGRLILNAQDTDSKSKIRRFEYNGDVDNTFGISGGFGEIAPTDFTYIGFNSTKIYSKEMIVNSSDEIFITGYVVYTDSNNKTFVAKQTASGLLDTNWNSGIGDGVRINDFYDDNTTQYGSSLATDGLGNIYSMSGFNGSYSEDRFVGIAKQDVNGDLVTAFGGDGFVFNSQQIADEKNIQPNISSDGSISFAGDVTSFFSIQGFNNYLTASGLPDVSKGESGVVTYSDNLVRGASSLVVLDSIADDSGNTFTLILRDSTDLVLEKLLASGELDTSFNSSGRTIFTTGPYAAVGRLYRDATGNIFIAAYDSTTDTVEFNAVAADGSAYSPFSGNSTLDFNINIDGTGSSSDDQLNVNDMLIDANGKLVIAGSINSGGSRQAVIARIDMSVPTLDKTGFNTAGTQGYQLFNNNENAFSEAYSRIVLRSDNSILAVGYSEDEGGQFGLAHVYTDAGLLDSNWAGTGQISFDTLTSSLNNRLVSVWQDIELQLDGSVILAGWGRDELDSIKSGLVLYLNQDGSINTNFADQGLFLDSVANTNIEFTALRTVGNALYLAGSSSNADSTPYSVKYALSSQFKPDITTSNTNDIADMDDGVAITINLEAFDLDSDNNELTWSLVGVDGGVVDGLDGQKGSSVSFTYTDNQSPGMYGITVTVTDSEGNATTKTYTVKVS
ncbi:tandem-95 repeat protein [Catenovulum sp. SM1970]|uniref:Ig-like domain-containing protein n=1 Tax=Marinifaba aquimaris TaxID=2741323 RepID=UPI001572FA54|nr:Ig-like domain-containing protein [Marinifaba aquimaris]NTS75727.1 tandem-95 repeat protein [Marinifaba aquimaris]